MNVTLHVTLRTCLGALLASTFWLTSCGGGSGGGSDTASTGNPSVTTLQATNVSYTRTMLVTISGKALDQGITMETDKLCSTVTQLPGVSDSSAVYTCVVGELGAYNITVRSTGGKFLASLKVTVPLPQVTLVTSKGNIVLELDYPSAPKTVDNFLRYVNDSPSFYKGAIFHDIAAGDLIRAGGYTTGLTPITKVHEPIELESKNGLKNLRGTVGMAREPAVANSATAQFYVNLKDAPERDYQSDAQPGLAVFARVVQGLDVAGAISTSPTRYDLAQGVGLGSILSPEIAITAASQTK
jgi:cyclophilin family peptidyl-prolyl cis-trans isomerase